MNGAWHYAEAERQIAQVDEGAADWEPLAASAQVHATLALAAATADPFAEGGDWIEAFQ